MPEEAKYLLFMYPSRPAAFVPLIDSYTRKMTAALRLSRQSDYVSAGVHECSCGAHSDCVHYFLPDGTITNSLCVHYLAIHRDDVSTRELALVNALNCGEAEPAHSELQTPVFAPGFFWDLLAPDEQPMKQFTAAKFIQTLLDSAVRRGKTEVSFNFGHDKITVTMHPQGSEKPAAPPMRWKAAIEWHMNRLEEFSGAVVELNNRPTNIHVTVSSNSEDVRYVISLRHQQPG